MTKPEIQKQDRHLLSQFELPLFLRHSIFVIPFVAAPLAAIWLGLSLWLGRKQVALARARKNQREIGSASYAR